MNPTDLINRLAAPEESGLDLALLVPLLRLLALGDPVPIDVLAVAAGLPIDQVRDKLGAVPDTEYDDIGRIVGQGLTLRPTRHRFTVDGQELYTWCALDTLIFPALLGQAARVESVSPVSGGTVSLVVEPDGVRDVEPSNAVVSLVNPEDLSALRSAFCNQVHYFISPQDAEPWLTDHPTAQVLPIADAYRLGTALATLALDQPQTLPSAQSGSACCH